MGTETLHVSQVPGWGWCCTVPGGPHFGLVFEYFVSALIIFCVLVSLFRNKWLQICKFLKGRISPREFPERTIFPWIPRCSHAHCSEIGLCLIIDGFIYCCASLFSWKIIITLMVCLIINDNGYTTSVYWTNGQTNESVCICVCVSVRAESVLYISILLNRQTW